MKGLTKLDLKQESFAQCIVKVTQMDVMPLLLLSLDVQLDQSIVSRVLILYLSSFGVSIAEDEVRLYCQSLMKVNT